MVNNGISRQVSRLISRSSSIVSCDKFRLPAMVSCWAGASCKKPAASEYGLGCRLGNASGGIGCRISGCCRRKNRRRSGRRRHGRRYRAFRPAARQPDAIRDGAGWCRDRTAAPGQYRRRISREFQPVSGACPAGRRAGPGRGPRWRRWAIPLRPAQQQGRFDRSSAGVTPRAAAPARIAPSGSAPNIRNVAVPGPRIVGRAAAFRIMVDEAATDRVAIVPIKRCAADQLMPEGIDPVLLSRPKSCRGCVARIAKKRRNSAS